MLILTIILVAISTASGSVIVEQNGINAPRVEEQEISLCKECEKFVLTLKNALDKPESVQKVINALNSVCDLPIVGGYKDECLNAAKDVVFVLHKLQGLLDDPAKVCGVIHFCKTKSDAVLAPKQFLLSIASRLMKDLHASFPYSSNDACGLCSSGLNRIKQSLQSPETVEKYQKQAMEFCEYLGHYKTDCKEIVDDYGQSVAKVIVDALCDPEQTCHRLKLCDSDGQNGRILDNNIQEVPARPHLNRLIQNITTIHSFFGINVGCLACKGGITIGIRMLNNEKSLNNLATTLTGLVCSLVPTDSQAGCLDFMDIYAKSTIQMALTEWTPATICASVGVCNNGFFQRMEPLPLNGKSFFGCQACKMASRILIHELQQSSVQKDILNAITRHCYDLPFGCGYKERCVSVLETYIPYALEDIVAVSYIPKMCEAAGLC